MLLPFLIFPIPASYPLLHALPSPERLPLPFP
jgi:hypothetical protein